MNYTMLRNATNGLESEDSPLESVYSPLENWPSGIPKERGLCGCGL